MRNYAMEGTGPIKVNDPALAERMAGLRNRLVGGGLTPARLESMDIIKPVVARPGLAVNADGSWVGLYHYFVTVGFKGRDDQQGFLRIERGPNRDDGTHALRVRKVLMNPTKPLHELRVELTSKNDELATPLQWQAQSLFIDADGELITDLSERESGRLKDGRFVVEMDGWDQRREIRGPATSNFSLMEAVGALPRNAGEEMHFTLLEELRLVKPDQRLRYDGSEAGLHHYRHLGWGVFPAQYWTTEAGLPIVVESHARALIHADLMLKDMPDPLHKALESEVTL